jgi:AraC family transcriptional regulator
MQALPAAGADNGLVDTVQSEKGSGDLHTNFRQKVSVAELAAVCELSPGHFLQVFTPTLGFRLISI